MQIPWPYVVVMCMVKLEAFAVGWDKERFFIGFLSRLGIISYEPCPKHCFVFLPQLHVPSYCPRQMYECACIHQHESFYKLLLAHEPYYAGLFKTVGQPTMHQHVILNESCIPFLFWPIPCSSALSVLIFTAQIRMLSETIDINTQATRCLFIWRHSVFFAFSLEKRLKINLNGYEQAHLKGITSKNWNK